MAGKPRKKQKPGISYRKRVTEINRIYDQHAPKGLPNREIWRRYIYPVYGITERTFYNMLKAPLKPGFKSVEAHQLTLFPITDED